MLSTRPPQKNILTSYKIDKIYWEPTAGFNYQPRLIMRTVPLDPEDYEPLAAALRHVAQLQKVEEMLEWWLRENQALDNTKKDKVVKAVNDLCDAARSPGPDGVSKYLKLNRKYDVVLTDWSLVAQDLERDLQPQFINASPPARTETQRNPQEIAQHFLEFTRHHNPYAFRDVEVKVSNKASSFQQVLELTLPERELKENMIYSNLEVFGQMMAHIRDIPQLDYIFPKSEDEDHFHYIVNYASNSLDQPRVIVPLAVDGLKQAVGRTLFGWTGRLGNEDKARGGKE